MNKDSVQNERGPRQSTIRKQMAIAFQNSKIRDCVGTLSGLTQPEVATKKVDSEIGQKLAPIQPLSIQILPNVDPKVEIISPKFCIQNFVFSQNSELGKFYLKNLISAVNAGNQTWFELTADVHQEKFEDFRMMLLAVEFVKNESFFELASADAEDVKNLCNGQADLIEFVNCLIKIHQILKPLFPLDSLFLHHLKVFLIRNQMDLELDAVKTAALLELLKYDLPDQFLSRLIEILNQLETIFLDAKIKQEFLDFFF